MKRKSITLMLLLICSMNIFAQHPLVGTWEFVSGKGTNVDGKPINQTSANLRGTKIITPTHYMFIQHIVRNDSVIFNIARAGTVKIEGNKYIETSTVTSSTDTGTTLSDFTWKIKGDQFIQTGTITMPDGRKFIVDELVYKKVKTNPVNPKNPIVGTWNQLSSEGTLFDGTKYSHTSPAVTRYLIMTPTHFMLMGHRDNTFEYALGGPYQMIKEKVVSVVSVASYKIEQGIKYSATYRLEGNKLYLYETASKADGKTRYWNDVYEKVEGK